jgi:hypothetical protein
MKHEVENPRHCSRPAGVRAIVSQGRRPREFCQRLRDDLVKRLGEPPPGELFP